MKDWGQGPFSERSGAGSGNAGTERLFHSHLPHRTRRKRIPARVGGASRWPSAGSFRFLLSDLYGGGIEKVGRDVLRLLCVLLFKFLIFRFFNRELREFTRKGRKRLLVMSYLLLGEEGD
jgi:hypothetical protein